MSEVRNLILTFSSLSSVVELARASAEALIICKRRGWNVTSSVSSDGGKGIEKALDGLPSAQGTWGRILSPLVLESRQLGAYRPPPSSSGRAYNR
jgi:hypothetical protein